MIEVVWIAASSDGLPNQFAGAGSKGLLEPVRMARTRPKMMNSFYTQLDRVVDLEHTGSAVKVDAWIKISERSTTGCLNQCRGTVEVYVEHITV